MLDIVLFLILEYSMIHYDCTDDIHYLEMNNNISLFLTELIL